MGSALPRSSPVLVVDDDEAFLALIQIILEEIGFSFRGARDGAEALQMLGEEEPEVVLLDRQLGEKDGMDVMRSIQARWPSIPVVMVTAHSSVDVAVQSIKLGMFDFLPKPVEKGRLLATLTKAVEHHRLLLCVEEFESEQTVLSEFEGMVGSSLPMRRLYKAIHSVAPGDASILVTGESGTGKELVARAIHRRSKRHAGPFLGVNMGSLPTELVEATLFGHEKGAFTGATEQRPGLCEQAAGGTLFLDEIAEMPMDLQPRLLRFLQERHFRRVGGSEEIQADVRIISATNREPVQAIEDGRLREDLYYRLNVIPLHLPALRERVSDIPLIAEHHLRRLAAMHGRTLEALSTDAADFLMACPWQGNVRELLNVLERAVVLNEGTSITRAMIEEAAPSSGAPIPHVGTGASSGAEDTEGVEIIPIEELERRAIKNALRRCDGSVGEAARQLGISPATIYRRIKSLGIST